MPNDLVEYLTAIVQPLFDEKRVVVWYDREGALEQPLRSAATHHGWRMVPGLEAKNPLAARAEIEEQFQADGLQWLADRKWLVYVPTDRHEPSWYEDLELAGRKVQKTLAEVIAERHELPTPKVAALVHEDGARRLVEKWDQVFPSGTWVLDLEKLAAAMLSLAFGEPGQLSPQSAVHRLLREPARLTEVLRAEGLTSTLNHVIRTQLGFGRLPESDVVRPELLVRAMMASELIHKGACEPSPAVHNFLPQKNHIATWAKMAEAAVKDLETRPSFVQLARGIEAEVHLVEHRTNLKQLATVASLPSVDANCSKKQWLVARPTREQRSEKPGMSCVTGQANDRNLLQPASRSPTIGRSFPPPRNCCSDATRQNRPFPHCLSRPPTKSSVDTPTGQLAGGASTTYTVGLNFASMTAVPM